MRYFRHVRHGSAETGESERDLSTGLASEDPYYEDPSIKRMQSFMVLYPKCVEVFFLRDSMRSNTIFVLAWLMSRLPRTTGPILGRRSF